MTLVLFSCDDGDLTQVSFEFDSSAAKACNTNVTNDFFIYKTQDKRALIIQLKEINFQNTITADLATQPTPIEIDASNVRVIYREYSGEITSATICSAVPAANPTVIEEHEATSGTFTITTTAIKSEPDATGATKITSYLHTLVFKDLVFDLGDGNSQINEAFTQVTYETNATSFTNFSGLTSLYSCENDNTFLFKYLNKQALVLDLSEADAAYLFSGASGEKIRLLSDENKLSHLFFDTTITSLSNDYFCTIPTPETPFISDLFTAENGITDQSGLIVVTSLPSDNGFKHTITLRNVRLAKGSLKVQMGDEFIFGEYETTN